MEIRTSRGDRGYTEISSDLTVSKDCIEARAIGDLDELISYLGLVKARAILSRDRVVLEKVQKDLSSIAVRVSACAGTAEYVVAGWKGPDVRWIKKKLRDIEKRVPVPGSFTLPGRGELSALLDVARAVARRAERSVVTLVREGKFKSAGVLTYLNCLSDLLFVMARETEIRTKDSFSAGQRPA